MRTYPLEETPDRVPVASKPQRSLHPSRCGGPTVPPHRGKASRPSFALSTAAFTVSDGRIGRRH